MYVLHFVNSIVIWIAEVRNLKTFINSPLYSSFPQNTCLMKAKCGRSTKEINQKNEHTFTKKSDHDLKFQKFVLR